MSSVRQSTFGDADLRDCSSWVTVRSVEDWPSCQARSHSISQLTLINVAGWKFDVYFELVDDSIVIWRILCLELEKIIPDSVEIIALYCQTDG